MRAALRITLLGLALLASAAHAQSTAAISTALPPETPLAVDPALSYGKLDNGLTYYIRPNTKPEKRVELRLVVNAGSLLETEQQRGLAHFVEHMAFNGSTHFKKNELVDFLRSMGIEFGSDSNAYTGFDETVYMLSVPLDKKENLSKSFLAMEDWASGVTFDADEVEKERGVIIEEARARKGASDRISKQFLPYFLAGSRHAERLPIGLESVIAKAPAEELKAFYRDWYRPNLMAVIVVGDVSVAEAVALVRKHFGHLKNPANAKPRTVFEVQTRTTTNALVISESETTQSTVEVNSNHQAKQPSRTVGEFFNQFKQSMALGILNERLYEVRQKPGAPFIRASVGTSSLVRYSEFVSSSAVINKNGSAAALNALLAEVKRAQQFGFTENEIARAKAGLAATFQNRYNERDNKKSNQLVARFQSHFLLGSTPIDAEQEWQIGQFMLAQLNVKGVNLAAKQVLADYSNAMAVLVAPEKTEFTIPSKEQLLAQVQQAQQQQVTAYQEKAVATQLLTELPKTGVLKKTQHIPEIGVTVLDFANGTRVYLKRTDFKNDQILLSGQRPGGYSLAAESDLVNNLLISSLPGITGSGAFSPTDLPKILAGKLASAGIGLGDYSASASGSSSVNDVETMLQLLYLHFTQPRRDQALFDTYVGRVKPALLGERNNPSRMFGDFYVRQLFNNHPRAVGLPSDAQINALNMDAMLAIQQTHFSNANGFRFALVGSFDEAKIIPLLTRYIGGLPSNTSIEFGVQHNGMRPVLGQQRIHFAKGKEAKSQGSIMFHGNAKYNPGSGMDLYLLEKVLQICLTEVLREQLSGAYSVGVSSTFSRVPYGNYSLSISIPSSPEKLESLMQTAKEVVADLVENGPNADDLQKAKAAYRTQRLVWEKENSFWLNNLLIYDAEGRDLRDIPSFSSQHVERASVKSLQKAAKKFLSGENRFESVFDPEPTAAKP